MELEKCKRATVGSFCKTRGLASRYLQIPPGTTKKHTANEQIKSCVDYCPKFSLIHTQILGRKGGCLLLIFLHADFAMCLCLPAYACRLLPPIFPGQHDLPAHVCVRGLDVQRAHQDGMARPAHIHHDAGVVPGQVAGWGLGFRPGRWLGLRV